MGMELNFVLNQTGFKFCVKIIEIKSLKNPKNQSQDWTRDFIINKKEKKKKLNLRSKVPFKV
jgi:hypothetical protein